MTLAGRTEPQARDIFDLNLLFARPEVADLKLSDGQKRWLDKAIEQAMSISCDDYVSKVVAYLDPDQAPLYQGRTAWDTMQGAVVTRLEALR